MDGTATDGSLGTTDVKGFVALSPGEIDLNIFAHQTPMYFLKRFCDSFMSDIDVRVDGHLRIFGPLSEINMEGKAVANGTVDISSLNTTYTLRDDTITLIPDHILFDHAAVYDKEGHQGFLTGSVDHENLGQFTFDMGIQADNLLAYDFKQFDGSTFSGTVYATGDCHIKGVSGEVTIDVDATPQKGTVFYYNAASPDMINDQGFIQWNDVTPQALDFSDLPSPNGAARPRQRRTRRGGGRRHPLQPSHELPHQCHA